MTTKAEKAQAKLDAENQTEATEGQDVTEATVAPVMTQEAMGQLTTSQIDALIKQAKGARRGAGRAESDKATAEIVEKGITDMLQALETATGKRVKTLDLRVKLNTVSGAYVTSKAMARMSIVAAPVKTEEVAGSEAALDAPVNPGE